jgi:hypothetical protein
VCCIPPSCKVCFCSVIEEDSASARPNAPPRKMVTEGLRKSLTKQVQNPPFLAVVSSSFFLTLTLSPRVTASLAPTAESSFVGTAFFNAVMLLNPHPPHPSFFSM